MTAGVLAASKTAGSSGVLERYNELKYINNAFTWSIMLRMMCWGCTPALSKD